MSGRANVCPTLSLSVEESSVSPDIASRTSWAATAAKASAISAIAIRVRSGPLAAGLTGSGS